MKAKVTVLVKTELEEAGEDTEGMVENTAKLQEKIMALTQINGEGGVNILTESGDFKSTYEILLAISKVWKDIDDTSQAALLELVAGKTRGSVVAALFQNGDILQESYESALNSDNSAMRELDTHLQSIQGRIDLFNNAVQTMWMNFMNTDALKFIIDIGTWVIKLADSFGLLESAIGAFAAVKTAISGIKTDFKAINDGTKETIQLFKTESVAVAENTAAKQANTIETNGNTVAEEINEQQKQETAGAIMAETTAEHADSGAKQANTANTIANTVATKANTVATKALAVTKNMATGLAVGLAMTLATSLVVKLGQAIADAANRMKELTDAAVKSADEVNDTRKSLEDYKDEINELRGVLADNTSTEQEAYDARSKLLDIQNALIDKFGLEAKGINLVTGAIEDQIDAIDKLSEKSAIQWLSDNTEAYKNAIEEVDKTYQNKDFVFYQEVGSYTTSTDYINGTETTYTPLQRTVNADDKEAYLDGIKQIIEDAGGSFIEGTPSILYGRSHYGGTSGNYTQTWKASFENMTRDELDAVFQQMQEYLIKFSGLHDVNLDAQITQLKTLRDKYIDEEYEKQKELYDQGRQQEAYAKYANEYGAIFDAQDKFKSSLTDRDQLAAIDEYTSAVETAFKATGGSLGEDGSLIFNPESETYHLQKFFADMHDKFAVQEFELNLKLNEDELKTRIETIIEQSGENGISTLDDNQLKDLTQRLQSNEFTVENGKYVDATGAYSHEQIAAVVRLQQVATEANISVEELIQSMVNLGYISGRPQEEKTETIEKLVKSYSALTTDLESYNEVLEQTSEIVLDNTEVTEEYKESLLALGISKDELNKYFDENNELIVKNAKGLNDLVKASKNNIARNAQLAKSQARLQYYELYKQIKNLTKGEKVNDASIQSNIDSLYEQMNALEKVIAKYSVLEAKLLGASNAYDKLEEAQAIDEAIDYGSKAEEVVKTLGDAINSNELGTATAQVAIEAIVPEGELEGLETAEAKMAKVYEYFTSGPISQLFTIEFDDEGAITNVQMVEDNIKNYIDSSDVFNGTWDNFTLDSSITSMEEFMQATNMTKEMAFAFLTELEKYDISWLEGKFDTIMDQLMGDDLEYTIQKTIDELSELEIKIAKGSITPEEIASYDELTNNLSTLGDTVRNNIFAYTQGMEALNGLKDNLAIYKKQLDAGEITDEQYQQRVAETTAQINELAQAMQQIEPAELELKLALDDVEQEIADFKTSNAELLMKVTIQKDADGNHSYELNDGAVINSDEKDKIESYIGLLNEEYKIKVLADDNPDDAASGLDKVKSAAEAVQVAIENIPDPKIDISDAVKAIEELQRVINSLTGVTVSITPKTTKASTTFPAWYYDDNVDGMAYAHGSLGAANTEEALTGELGPEIRVRGNRWELIGRDGAEFTDVKKGDVIFNSKQTEQLLRNGHISSRGRAYAHGTSGTAFKDAIGTTLKETEDFEKEIKANNRTASSALAAANAAVQATQTIQKSAATNNSLLSSAVAGINTWSGSYLSGNNTGDLNDDYKNQPNDEFEETIDWIEIRLEELDETLGQLNAELENAVGYTAQNNKIQEIINKNNEKIANVRLGAAEYESEANKYLQQLDEHYQSLAQDGEIDIEDFTEAADEATVEAIQKYREYAQKAADLRRQEEELLTEISNLAKQKFDNVANQYENEISLIENVNEQLEAQVSLMEDRGYVAATAYYNAMMDQAEDRQKKLAAEKDELQKVLDAEVAAGHIQVYDDNWYEMVNAIYDVDAAIVECTADLESFQNAINDIYWENFDELINRLDYLKNETQNLIDLMDKDDMVTTPETEDGWGANQVEWTKEGLASLGLYAQQMEIAEYQAKQYADEIKKLEANHDDYIRNGIYSESEYLAKLNELKDAQYDSIEAYYDAQDAIKDLNEARVDSIKDGIEKQIKAVEKLIEKEKELLDAEKNAYDWEKSVSQQTKSISEIRRKLMAIENDTSIAATAKRKQLEAELAEKQTELEEMYYEKSVENKQNALDKELESFQTEKEAEMEKWDEYLTNIETIVAESLNIVQANASGVYDTLNAKANEYDLNVSEAVMSPWKDGTLAVSDYQTAFDTAMSSTMDQLDALKGAWQNVIDKMEEAARVNMAEQKASNDKITNVTPSQTSTTTTPVTPTTPARNAPDDYTVKPGDTLWDIAGRFYGDATRWREIYNLNKSVIGNNPDLIYPGQRFKMPAYAKGTMGTKKDELAWIDELGEELQLVPDGNGRLAYIQKGTSILNHDITERLMDLAMNPQDMLDRNRPVIGVHPEIHNTEVNITMDIAEVVHIDKVDNDTLPDLTKVVEKQLDKYMKGLNQQIRRYAK